MIANTDTRPSASKPHSPNEALRRIFEPAQSSSNLQKASTRDFSSYSESTAAQAEALQPLRDIVLDNIVIKLQDDSLDVFVPPYPQVWTNSQGNAAPQSYGATAGGDSFANYFDLYQMPNMPNDAWINLGSAIWIQFVPLITPGIAQVRPYAPYRYKWMVGAGNPGRAENYAGFGILVLSWDLAGNDRATEQDYTYFGSCPKSVIGVEGF